MLCSQFAELKTSVLTVCAQTLPDISMRGLRSEGNMSTRALAMLVCSALPLALVPSRICASFHGRHILALHNRDIWLSKINIECVFFFHSLVKGFFSQLG